MGRKIFQPNKYGMVICPRCNGQRYIQVAKRQCCPNCGGFGYVRDEKEKDADTDKPIKNIKIMSLWNKGG